MSGTPDGISGISRSMQTSVSLWPWQENLNFFARSHSIQRTKIEEPYLLRPRAGTNRVSHLLYFIGQIGHKVIHKISRITLNARKTRYIGKGQISGIKSQ